MAAPGTTAAEGDAAGLLPFGTARTSAAASADEAGSKGHVPHKVALGYMLLPDYIQTAALSRWAAAHHAEHITASDAMTATLLALSIAHIVCQVDGLSRQLPCLEHHEDQKPYAA